MGHTIEDTFILSKQGWIPILSTAALFLFFVVAGWSLFEFSFGALLIALLILFRNPERSSQLHEPLSIVSSVDGVVLGIEESVIGERKMKKITFLNSLWSVSMLRAPFDGTMEGCQVRHGVSLPLNHPLSEKLNEKALLSFRSVEGNEIVMEHLSDRSCFSIAIEGDEGKKIKEGSRYGFLAKGRTVVYLPEDAIVTLHLGADVRAGETLIGRFTA